MAEDTVFSRIVGGEIDADVVHEDGLCMAFRDIDPQAPVHILVIPKEPIPSLFEVGSRDQQLLGQLLVVAGKIAREQGLTSGYRCVINTGADGGQQVDHLHLHLLGGRQMEWPPG